MDTWIFLSASGGIFLSMFYGFSKTLRNKHSYWKLVMSMGVVLLPFVFTTPLINNRYELVAVIGGFVYGASMTLFYNGLGHVSALTSAILGQMIPGVVTILAWVVRGKEMTSSEFLALFMMVGGSMLAALKKGGKDSPKGVFLVTTAVFLTSSYNVLADYAQDMTGMSGFELFMFVRTGVLASVASMLLLPARKEMISLFSIGKEQLRFYGNELLFLAFSLLYLLAVAAQGTQGNVGLVGTVYFATVQVCMFAKAAKDKEEGLRRKLVGASIAFAGLLYLAAH